MSRSYYDILQIARDAPDPEIKKAYHKLARSFHPDKAKDEAERGRFEEEFALITKAYNQLKDPEARALYDDQLERERSAATAAATGSAGGGGGAVGAGSASLSAAPGGTRPPTGTGPGAGVNVEAGRKEIAKRAFAQGVRLLQMKDYERAAEFLRAAAKNDDTQALYHDRLAVSLLRSRRSFSDAVAAAKRACELDPYKTEYKMHLAELYEAIGSTKLAEDVYSDILKWDPENTIAAEKVKGKAREARESGLMKWWKTFVGRK